LGLIFLHTFHPKPQELLLVSLDLSPLKRKGRDKYRLRSKGNSIQDSTKDKERKGIIHGILNALQAPVICLAIMKERKEREE
jgi:hypothetical protein